MKRKLSLTALALMTFGASMTSAPAPAGAATLLKSSWWYRAHTADSDTFLPPATPAIPGGAPTAPAAVPAPAPPTVPAGSLLVEGTAEGATAVAALSWTMTSSEMRPVLTLTPSGSSNVPADAVILACRAAVSWAKPESEPGAWEEKPLVDCGASVQGIPNPDGTIAFGLAPLVSGDTLDVVLSPGLAQSQPVRVGSSFSLSFSSAEGATLATDTQQPTVGAGFTSGGSSSSPSSSPAFSTPSGIVPLVGVAVGQPALPPEAQAPTVPQQAALPPTTTSGADDSDARGVAFLILLAGLAFAGLSYLTPARDEGSTIGLGRFRKPAPAETLTQAMEPVQGGLGRFARQRTAPPPALS